MLCNNTEHYIYSNNDDTVYFCRKVDKMHTNYTSDPEQGTLLNSSSLVNGNYILGRSQGYCCILKNNFGCKLFFSFAYLEGII